MKVMKLATRADTPATIRTALAKRSPVPRGSVSVAARPVRVPVCMVVWWARAEARRAAVEKLGWVQAQLGEAGSVAAAGGRGHVCSGTSVVGLVPKSGGAPDARNAEGSSGPRASLAADTGMGRWGCERDGAAVDGCCSCANSCETNFQPEQPSIVSQSRRGPDRCQRLCIARDSTSSTSMRGRGPR